MSHLPRAANFTSHTPFNSLATQGLCTDCPHLMRHFSRHLRERSHCTFVAERASEDMHGVNLELEILAPHLKRSLQQQLPHETQKMLKQQPGPRHRLARLPLHLAGTPQACQGSVVADCGQDEQVSCAMPSEQKSLTATHMINTTGSQRCNEPALCTAGVKSKLMAEFTPLVQAQIAPFHNTCLHCAGQLT